MNTHDKYFDTDMSGSVAVIGMAGRFPGSDNLDRFWRNLIEGVESVTEFSDDELLESGVTPELINSPKYVRKGFILRNIEYFDHDFFGYSKGDACIMDPQYRIFFECAWEAFEDAGYSPGEIYGAVGVYAGTGNNSYLLKKFHAEVDKINSVEDFQIFLSNEKDFLSTRISYAFDLKGPSLTIQTACSTSLVCIHTACSSLLNYECDMALAGGVSVSVPQKVGYKYQRGMVYSPEGKCRAFDADAKGMTSGNGAGAVILKRLEEAIADSDNIYAVVKGSAINNDGALKIGYTAPAIDGQADVISDALAISDVKPETVSYVETHGTGTPMGDPIEISALTKAFSAGTGKKNFCAIGSVKTNIGHLNAAAGVAGFIKTVLALKNKRIPPSLHYKKPNPKIAFDETPFFVNSEPGEWKRNGKLLRAGVSSFGMGGTNAHVILEEYPEAAPRKNEKKYKLLPLSARSRSGLARIAKNLADYLIQKRDISLSDTAYTLQTGRRRFEYSNYVVCKGVEDAVPKLYGLGGRADSSAGDNTGDCSLVFILSGNWFKFCEPICSELYETETAFHDAVNGCLSDLSGKDIAGFNGLVKIPSAEIKSFIVEYALAKMWISWGVSPNALIGSGTGFLAALCIGGMLPVKEILDILSGGGLNNAVRKSALPVYGLKSMVPVTCEDIRATDLLKAHYQYSGDAGDGRTGNSLPGFEGNTVLLSVNQNCRLSNGVFNSFTSPEFRNTLLAFSSDDMEKEGIKPFYNTLGNLWLNGVRVNFGAFNRGLGNKKVSLPSYPFERDYCWYEN